MLYRAKYHYCLVKTKRRKSLEYKPVSLIYYYTKQECAKEKNDLSLAVTWEQ